jgi:hypothetical protein
VKSPAFIGDVPCMALAGVGSLACDCNERVERIRHVSARMIMLPNLYNQFVDVDRYG